MLWQSPHSLWFLLAVPVFLGLFGWLWVQQNRALKRFGDTRVLAPLVLAAASWKTWARVALSCIAMAALAIAVAGPLYGSRTMVLRKRGLDIVIALDFSKSMLARDVRPNRIDRAKAEVMRFLSSLDGDRVGLVAFAGDTMEFPMTDDYASIGLFLRDLGPYDMPVGGTAIGRALTTARALLLRASGETDPATSPSEANDDGTAANAPAAAPRSTRSRVVILLTDGEDHEGEPAQAARALADIGAKLYTVGIGTRTGEPIPTYAPDGTWTGYVRDEAGAVVTTSLTEDNENALRAFASSTGGAYISAGRGAVGMGEVREAIAGLHREENAQRRVTIHENRYLYALAVATFALIADTLLSLWWRPRVAPGEQPFSEGGAS